MTTGTCAARTDVPVSDTRHDERHYRTPKAGDTVTYRSRHGDVPATIIAADRTLAALIYPDRTMGVGLYNLTATHGANQGQWRWPAIPAPDAT